MGLGKPDAFGGRGTVIRTGGLTTVKSGRAGLGSTLDAGGSAGPVSLAPTDGAT
jgi:hypothetical protein